MSSNLTSTYSLGDVADVYDGPHATPKKLEQGDAIFLSISSLEQGRLNLEQSSYISEEDYIKWTRRVTPQPGDVVFSYETKIGEASIIPEGLRCCLGRRMGLLRAKKNKIIPDFLLYAYLSPAFQEVIREKTIHGSTTDRLSIKEMPSFKIQIPDFRKQNEIIKILKSIDGKLEFNQQINKTLEQMAQALFKSWFVDFEPVKAKMVVLEAGGSQEDATLAAMTAISGKDADALAVFEREHPEQYAQLKATAELFPAAMQDSELGEIPVGWFVGDLSNIALLNTESWSKKNAPESVSYVDLANTKWGVINSVEVYKFSDAPSRARRILRPCDTIVGTVRPGNGSYSYISKPGLTGSTGFAVLTPKARIFSEYIYLCVTSNESIERLAHLADGGAYPAVNADVVLSTQCVLPIESETKEALLKVFSSRTEVFFSYRANNLDVNEVLTSIRDTLLPKLLSGEITLPEAEQIISEEA
ncbi:hypothetical protein J3608_000288 [Salmonella enterica subsp. enterica serovar Pasing]|uniref:restriction endonuclease subunit S n=1 Tax=Salmonella enterica TaxID=28901 RepID=UPI00296B6777|nr:hypothetical protein [Salmonella enterica subsp. enterica serovar Pasing]EJA6486671.1 restriction endonuclease subunit S [Salmonella enterica subsp. enterica serovar Pasing]HAU6761441.1 hypothetical protein [Salmonella enterica subsp. enterica serovar Pasing]